MEFNDIELVVVLIQMKDGSAHQVLTSDENKKSALLMIHIADNGLKLDKELKPLIFETK